MTKFEWDPAKAQSNLKKHRERRWQTLGTVEGHLLLLVAHTVRDDEDGTELIRIISARRAEPKERKHYAQNCSP